MRHTRGFTLIELLVVIAVISVLMAILMPSLQKAKSMAQNSKCKGNLKSYGLAVSMYTTDNDGKFVDPWLCYFYTRDALPGEAGVSRHRQLRWCNGDVNLRDYSEYAGPFFRYLLDARAFICPKFYTLAQSSMSEDQHFKAVGSSVTNYKPWYNYTQNAYLGPPNSDLKGLRVSRIHNVFQPATTYSFTEESCFVNPEYNASGLNDTYMIPGRKDMVNPWLAQSGFNVWEVKPGPSSTDPSYDGVFFDVIAGFHNAPSNDKLGGRGNCAFLDGHVDAHPRSETFPLAWPGGTLSGPIP